MIHAALRVVENVETFCPESTEMRRLFLVLLIAEACFGQQQQQLVQDLEQIIGKEVIAQRMPLCQPGTFKIVTTYAGQHAKVISLKASNVQRVSAGNMSKLAPDLRAFLEDTQKAATILIQFADGTQLDSCGPVSPSRLSSYFELAPGQTLPVARAAVAQAPIVQAPTAEPPAIVPTVPAALATSVAPVAPVISKVEKPKSVQSASNLSDEEVSQAIKGFGGTHWVIIRDQGLMAAQGNQQPSITLYMPEAVLSSQSSSAKRQYTQYIPSEEDKRRALTIVAEGYSGKTITEGCTSITRIVLLSDPSGGVVEEAYLSEPLDETWRNNYGATDHCQALKAKFSLDSVQKVRAAARNGEFFVAVFSGTVNTKSYKIKTKHQSKLGL